MSPTDEAAQILTRLFEALARANGKTLNARSREDIKRACELLSSAGAELDDLLDDMPPTPRSSPGERAVPAEIERWREQRDRR